MTMSENADSGPLVRLNIGAGDIALPGFTPIDKKLGHEAGNLKEYADGTVDEIYASHVLEHFPAAFVSGVVTEWCRVLKPGGRLRIGVPDFRKVAESYIDGKKLPHAGYIMGGQTDKDDFHFAMFDAETLRDVLEHAGFERIGYWECIISDCSALPISLNMEGYKPGRRATVLEFPALIGSEPVIPAIPEPPFAFPRVAAVMSVPRLSFSQNMACLLTTLPNLHVNYVQVQGAFWGQCLERGMDMCLESNPEYILTIDYDTVFNVDMVVRLAKLISSHPEVDALAPLQLRREDEGVLFTLQQRLDHNEKHTSSAHLGTFDGELIPVASAHFGLTLLRAEKIKAMPRPWFHSIPAPDNTWGDGRIDDDMSFWKKWGELGNTLCLAGHISVGHLQLMVSWPDRALQPIYQHSTEYQEFGQPARARK